MLSDEQFDVLVARLEEQARRDPRGYQLRVLMLALLGNAYMAGILLLLCGLLVVLVLSVVVLKALAIKLILVVGVFLWMILKALWIKIDPPQGTEIKARQSPELFAMIEDLRRQLGAPRFHHVLISDDFNAGVVQSPRLGIFGWPRNYLLLGLPLMKTLSVEQFRAVLAHEFGHLARGHGRLANWLYRQRLRWSRLLRTLEANASSGTFLFKPFLNWFAPYFNAYSFPLARANEYEADATSVRLTSRRAAAEALTSSNVVASYLDERYWPGITRQVEDLPQPSFMPYHGMTQGVATELDDDSVQRWLQQAMARPTTSADTHPALSDRLQAIGEEPRLATPVLGESADRLLGEALPAITESFDRRWREAIEPSWQERHREVQQGRQQLAELNARVDAGEELPVKEGYERARLTESVGKDADSALAQLRQLAARAPDDVSLRFVLADRLLARDEVEGFALLEEAMRQDEDYLAAGYERLRDYCWRNDRQDEAHVWHQRLLERSAVLDAAALEREQLLLGDKFERHGLAESAIAELRESLRGIAGLRKAYFLKKRVKQLEHRPCYVLGYSVTGFFQLHRKQRAQDVLARIQAQAIFPGETLIINIDGGNYRFGRKFRWMRGTRLL